jgi:gamma-glutamyltranspeptidase/glutathione hydrolase
MLKAIEGFEVSRWPALSVERLHPLTEIGRQAYADRDCFICDPHSCSIPVAQLLSDEYAEKIRRRVSFERRQDGFAPILVPQHSDTTFVAVVDSERNTVAFINSIFDDFGSGIAASKSGVIFHNRACGFVLDRGHPNVIAGRKRPLNTIIPAMLTRNGRAVMPFAVTGGQFQPFGQVQLVSNILDYGMGIQAAIDHPRIFAWNDTIQAEGTLPVSVREGLAALGHKVVPAENPLGTAQAIWIDWEAGLLRGGADGRRDGLAAGW